MFGHSLTTVCTRCGAFVDLEGTTRKTLEERINAYFSKKEAKQDKEYKGSLKLVPGLKKYSINLKTNELRLVDYKTDFDFELDANGVIKLDKSGEPIVKKVNRKATYDPFLMYIDASNDTNAIRKANGFIRTVKRGVVITCVSTGSPLTP